MKKELVSFEGVHCANCSAPMQGEFCHECGQSIHTVLRPMHHMVEDTLDMVFHVDGRVFHTLPPLFLRPGFLTMEYFAGRRQRYVAPFRLMFVLSLLAFFVCHLAVDNLDIMKVQTEASAGTGNFAKDLTPSDVRARFEQERKDMLQQSGQSTTTGNKVFNKLVEIERDHANHRLSELGARPIPAESNPDIGFESKPVNISWLPDALNHSLTRSAARAAANVMAMKNGGEQGAEARERMVASTFHVLPQTMFVLMPLFALLLKFTYIFKRRLYMEHLIVALHSHAFLFLTLLLGMLLYLLHGWVATHAAWSGGLFRVMGWALEIWSLLYLLLMQKRVYRQGWFMTLVKYGFLGWVYFTMVSVAVVCAAALGMTN
ncbi:DUF3667 domain-containing protein [Dyella solisilvae]|uniref:DUF3667 domain-containing protein n=1 Tax=Dyella solisilvae TaxID=1920168 RepID=A0A370KD20_9GAMM|nr:DUF3667 domain-containing protein [Dyella solisilvae]RDJ00557.1 DUF3667 domain-containing protein [Dyella solisilvae]